MDGGLHILHVYKENQARGDLCMGYCIPRAHFERMVKEVALEQMQREDVTREHRRKKLKWRKDALLVLQGETEKFIQECLRETCVWQKMSPYRRGMLSWISQHMFK